MLKKLILIPFICSVVLAKGISGSVEAESKPGEESASKEPRKILLVSTMHFSQKWCFGLLATTLHQIEQQYPDSNFDLLELNAYAESNQAYKQKTIPYLKAIAEGKYSMIIPVMGKAVDILAENARNIPQSTNIVACADIDSLKRLKAAHENTTGLYTASDISKTVDLALEIFPNAQRIIIISDTDKSGEVPLATFNPNQDKYADKSLKIVSDDIFTTEQMLSEVACAKPTDIIVFCQWRNFAKDKFPSQEYVAEKIAKHAKIPFFTLSHTFMDCGAMGGFVSLSKKNGERLGEIAQKVLSGISAADIPFEKTSSNNVIDMEVAESFGIKIPKLPSNTVYANYTYLFLETNWHIVLLTALAFLACIAAIIALRRKNILEKRTRVVYEMLPLYFFVSSLDGKVVLSHSMDSDAKPVKRLSDYGEIEEMEFKKAFRQLVENPDTQSVRFDYKNSKGRFCETIVKRVPQNIYGKDFFVAVTVDITQLEKNRERIEDSRRFYETILNTLPLYITVLNASKGNVYNFWNKLNFETIPIKPENVLNRNYHDIALLKDQALVIDQMRLTTLEKGTAQAKHKITDKRGNKRIVSSKMVRVSDVVGEDYLAIVGADITEEETLKDKLTQTVKDLEEALKREQETNQSLAKAMKAVQEASKAKSYFFAAMSHELRTPLNSVIGYSELVLDDKLPKEEIFENLKNINFSTNSLLQLINDILDLSKLQSDKIEIVKDPISVKLFMQNLARIFALAAKNKGLKLNLSVSEDIPIVMLDIMRLRQIMTNLLGNAVKFTQNGRVDVNVRYKNNTLAFEVSDTGMGIAEEYLDSIFNPFEQQSARIVKDQNKAQGTGLGLAISRGLAEKLNGKIKVKSKLGKGSIFTLELYDVEIAPLGTIASNAEKQKNTEPDNSNGNSYGEFKVLIVDDVPMNLKVLGSVLKKMNVDYIAASNAKDAIKIIVENAPNIVLTDLWMPDMNGIDLAKSVRSNDKTKDTPVIVVTADSQIMGQNDVFDDILIKPITMEKLDKVVRKFGHTNDSKRKTQPA